MQRADSPEGFPRVKGAVGDHALSARPVGSWGGRPLPDLERSWESATVFFFFFFESGCISQVKITKYLKLLGNSHMGSRRASAPLAR